MDPKEPAFFKAPEYEIRIYVLKKVGYLRLRSGLEFCCLGSPRGLGPKGLLKWGEEMRGPGLGFRV